MRSHALVSLSLVVALVAACSGGTASPGPADGGTSCSFRLGGAITGSFACTSSSAQWTSADNRGGFTMSFVGNGGADPNVTVGIGFPGEPAAGTYKDTDTGAGGAMFVDGQASYTARVTAGGIRQGSYTLAFASVAPASTQAGRTTYKVTGTLDATLIPAQAGGSGAVTMHVDFN